MGRPAVFLGLGSNLGDREGSIESALAGLEARGFHVAARSSLYLTEPVGGPPQGWFVNAVAQGDTALEPETLLEECLAVERDLGRVRSVKDGPRIVDLDLLLYGDLVLQTPELRVPHPRLHERRFVLVPLAEIAPGAWHPVLRLTAAEMLERCDDDSEVVKAAPRESPS
jgi:2-amino-4-hydroxy-6-hydroxymethyldihydropteridine diphosphokinase